MSDALTSRSCTTEHPSQIQCGAKRQKMPLSVRVWICDGCSVVHDRDVNASLNVLAAGLAVGTDIGPLASGLNGSPVTALSVAGVSG